MPAIYSATGPYGPNWNGMVWDPQSQSYIPPTQASQIHSINQQNTAAGNIAEGTAAGTYHAPMSAAEEAASALALRELAMREASQPSAQQLNQSRVDASQAAAQASGAYDPPPDPGVAQAENQARVDAAQAAARSSGAYDPSGDRTVTYTPNRGMVGMSLGGGASIPASDNQYTPNTGQPVSPPPSIAALDTPYYREGGPVDTGPARVDPAQAQYARQAAQDALDLQAAQVRAQVAATTSSTQLAREQQAFAEQQAQQQASVRAASQAALIAAINGTSSAAPTVSFDPYGGSAGQAYTDQAYHDAESATLTGAKESGGQQLAGSLKGLQQVMANRGIGGSGIEAKNTRDLFGDYLAGQSAVTGNLGVARAQRAGQVTDRNYAAALDVAKTNTQVAADAARQRLSSLVSAYGMNY